MGVNYQSLEDMLGMIKQMPPEYRLRLMQGILETLIPMATQTNKILKFGEYKDFDGPMSTPEDYVVAEWTPSERELNGE